MLDVVFLGVEAFEIGLAGIFNERGVVKANLARRRNETTTIVTEGVPIILNVYHRIGFEEVWFTQVLFARGMDVEKRNDGDFAGRFELHIVTETNEHRFQNPQ